MRIKIKYILIFVFVILFILFLNLIYFFNINRINIIKPVLTKGYNNFNAKEYIVRGYSLNPLIKNNDCIYILKDYYKDNKIKHEDIIAYDFIGNEDLIIKIVKALPGDKFEMRENEDQKWNIFINNSILKNSEGLSYSLNEQKSKMLRLYSKNYPIIPDNRYLILGNSPEGSLDSSKFGFADRENIIGKVKKCAD